MKFRNIGTRYRKMLCIAAMLFALAAIFFTCWRLRPLDDEELLGSDAVVEREEWYLLCNDTDTLMAFKDFEGDTLLVGASEKTDSVEHRIVRVQAQWINRWPVLPSCSGRMMLHAPDTTSLCKAGASEIRNIISSQVSYLDRCLTTIGEHKEQTAYYLRTHNVTEIGFDVVARMQQRLASHADSIGRIKTLLGNIGKDSSLRILYQARYFTYLPTDSGVIRTECMVSEQHKGLLVVRTKDGRMPQGKSSRLTFYDTGTIEKRLSERPAPRIILPKDIRIDTLGLYHGDMDSTGVPHGYGKLMSHDMYYYEGEWDHGKRHGFGMALLPGKRMQIGEWKDDEYLGERITYTDERIYGIDISRHQHEKGRKRFKINWKNLAITHLGHISKKKIDGTVNYPISFIYIKSTEGASIFNKYFHADYRAARQHGYKVGTYHFFSTRTTGAKQAMFFLKKAKYQRGDFPPVLDIEPSAKQIAQMGGRTAMFNHIRKWLTMVEQAWRVKPILYVSQTFVNKYLVSAPDLLKNYKVWIARYGEYKPDINLVYWQLCPDGRVRGIQTEVDINVFNGFEPEWKEFLSEE